MNQLEEYYYSRIENLRFVEFLDEIKDLNLKLDKEMKIRIYKLWIMGYSRKQIREWLNEF